MRKVALSILLITGFLLAQAGCASLVPPASLDVIATTKPEISASDRFLRTLWTGATALMMEEHADSSTASGGNPGNMIVSLVPVSAETG